MRRPRITITLNQNVLHNLDKLIDGQKIRNRSHAIEYVLSNFFKPSVKKAVILAGGRGTKFRPFTYEIPKSLLPIKGKPILEHMIENLKKNEIYDLIICIGYLGKKIKDYFGSGAKYGVKITYSEEDQPLLTGGTLNQARKLMKEETFLLVHGDILTDFYFRDMINFHLEEDALATIAMTSVNQPSEFGQLQLHGTTLVNFYQKVAGKQVKSHLVNCGIYVLSPEIFDYFPKNRNSFLLEDIIQKLIAEKKAHGFVYEGQWFDVGTLANYEKAIKEYLPPNQKSKPKT